MIKIEVIRELGSEFYLARELGNERDLERYVVVAWSFNFDELILMRDDLTEPEVEDYLSKGKTIENKWQTEVRE